jgi:D-inositol-3-phosphate glycosyltransferase
MRISIVGPVYPYRGGISQFTTSFAHELTLSGADVQVMSFQRQYPGWLYPGQSDKDPSMQHDEVSAEYILDPLYPWSWNRAARKIISFRPDMVIIQWWTTFWSPAYFFLCNALRRRGIPCVFTIHNVIPHEKRLPDVMLCRLALSQGKAFITLSPNESSRLHALLSGSRIFQSRLPVPRMNLSGQNRAESRREMGIPAQQPVLLFFGIVRPYKGLLVLLNSLSILKKEGLTPWLYAVGEFWENVEDYQREITKLGLQDQIFLENRYVPNEELCRFFSSADAFIAPYIHGTQSAAIKTAMGYGLPVLASDQISSDLPQDSYPVFVHKAGDEKDLAASIREFFHSEKRIGPVLQSQNGWSDLIALVEQMRVEL